ncbi:hypothetical protein TYRP_020801 [Tyrophagus putrescentiae]|nr:hypothetical protein TYRP_020801 [Tyrophagus putrescentiae]
MAYSTRNQNQKFLASLDLPSREVKLAPLTPNAFYRCDKIAATYQLFGRNAPVFTDAVATPEQLYTFAMTGKPTGYKAHGVSLKNCHLYPLILNDEEKKKLKATVKAYVSAAYPTNFGEPDGSGEEKTKGTSKSKKVAKRLKPKKKKQQKRVVKRPVKVDSTEEDSGEATTDSQATIENTLSGSAASSSSTSVASSPAANDDDDDDDDDNNDDENNDNNNNSSSSNEPKMNASQEMTLVQNYFPRGPLSEVRLIAAVLLLPGKKAKALIFAENALYCCTLSPFIKLEKLSDGEQIAEAFRETEGQGEDMKTAVFDQATLTAYVKAVIRSDEVDDSGIGSGGTRHQIITYQLNTEDSSGVSPGKWDRLELPNEPENGVDKDPGELLKSAKCIALWKRQLFVFLKTPIEKFDEEGNLIVYNRLFSCFKVMIISLDEGNSWRVVDTAALAVNKSIGLAPANKFKLVQRGPGGQHLLGVFTRFEEDEDGEDYLNRRKNVVNSVWSLDLETLQWSCLNTGTEAVAGRANAAPADNRELKMVETPSLTRMAIAANANGLWILPRGDVDVPLEQHRKSAPVKIDLFYMPLN